MEISPVDIEIRTRMRAACKQYHQGKDLLGDEDDWQAFLRMARVVQRDPLTHTYEEIRAAIEPVYHRMKLIGGGRPA